MRRFVIAAMLAVLLVLSTAGSASAERGCVLDVLGIKVCGELLTPLPTVTVTVRPPPVHVTVGVPVPGPTRTVTVPGLPGSTQTETVRVPGPTVTKTVRVPTATKTGNAGPTQGPNQPQSTVTATSTAVSPSGQPSQTRGTIGPSNGDEPFFNLHGGPPAPVKVGIGLLSLLAILACILGGMAYAFRRGYNAKGKEDTNFMRDILDSVKTGRGKHS